MVQGPVRPTACANSEIDSRAIWILVLPPPPLWPIEPETSTMMITSGVPAVVSCSVIGAHISLKSYASAEVLMVKHAAAANAALKRVLFMYVVCLIVGSNQQGLAKALPNVRSGGSRRSSIRWAETSQNHRVILHDWM